MHPQSSSLSGLVSRDGIDMLMRLLLPPWPINGVDKIHVLCLDALLLCSLDYGQRLTNCPSHDGTAECVTCVLVNLLACVCGRLASASGVIRDMARDPYLKSCRDCSSHHCRNIRWLYILLSFFRCSGRSEWIVIGCVTSYRECCSNCHMN